MNRKRKGAKRRLLNSDSDRDSPVLKRATTRPEKVEESESEPAFIIKRVSQPAPAEKEKPPDREERFNANVYTIRIPPLDVNKMFTEIVTESHHNPEMLSNLRSMVSICAKILEEKKSLFKKKWAQLRNSHCSQDEYFKREKELRNIESEELSDVKDDTISKLGYCKIRGF